MAKALKSDFEQKLAEFGKSLRGKNQNRPPRIALIILANTLDKVLSKPCKTDIKTVRTNFQKIAAHFDYEFTYIEISGKDYCWDNVDKAIEQFPLASEDFMPHNDDVVIFYYSGHGFSYEKDRYSKFPQIDVRPPNSKVNPNHIDFIKDNTLNIRDVLNLVSFRGIRVNIAIADCCNTTIPFKRPKENLHDAWASEKMLLPKFQNLTKKQYTDDFFVVDILVSSSQFGQPAIANGGSGSIFTNNLMVALTELTTKPVKGEAYIPWDRLLKKVSAKVFKQSKGFDIGGGVAGKQKAVFQVYGKSY